MAGLAIAAGLSGPARHPMRPEAPQRASAAPRRTDGFGAIVLARHGRRPLGFCGRLLVEAATATDTEGAALPVASQVALYETEAGGIVAAIRHMQPGHDVPALTYAEPFADGEALKHWLGTHDPLADLPVQALLPHDSDALPPALSLAAAGREISRIRAGFHALLAALLAPMTDPEPAPEHAMQAAAGQPHASLHAEGTSHP